MAQFEHEVFVHYRDLDPRNHVNHAHFVSYLEEGKAALFREEIGDQLADAGTAIRHLEVEFMAPIEADQRVTVALGPIEIGTTSFTIEYEMWVCDTTVARATTVSVLLDEEGSPTPLPDHWVEVFERYG